MNERHLDWKKVFKDILSKSQSPNDDTKSEQIDSEPSSHVSNSETKSSDESYSSSLKLEKSSNNERYECKVDCNQSSCQKAPRTFSCKKNNAHVKSYSYTEETCSQTVEVPEWNKVFKTILGNDSPTREAQQKNVDFQLKTRKSTPPKKYSVPDHGKRSFLKKKQFCSVRKLEMDAAEKEVREMFAQSRLLKYDCSFKSLNDLAGTGVDIFKCDEKLTFGEKTKSKVEYGDSVEFGEKTKSKVESEDYSSDHYVKPGFPVTAFVANIKTITRADILDSPNFEITEWWDDD